MRWKKIRSGIHLSPEPILFSAPAPEDDHRITHCQVCHIRLNMYNHTGLCGAHYRREFEKVKDNPNQFLIDPHGRIVHRRRDSKPKPPKMSQSHTPPLKLAA